MKLFFRDARASTLAGGRLAEGLLVLIFVALAHAAALLALSSPQTARRSLEPVLVEVLSTPVAAQPAPASPRQPDKGVERAAAPSSRTSAARPNSKPRPRPPVASHVPLPQARSITPEPADPDGLAFPNDVLESTGPRPAAETQVASISSGERRPVAAGPTLRPRLVPPRFDDPRLDNPSAEYPRLARRLGEQGKVVLRVFVGSGGTARQVELYASSGSPRLDRAARDAVARWKFIPARVGERSVDAWLLIPIVFRLEG